MRPPPPLTQLQYFPVTGGIALLSIVVTVAMWLKYPIAPLEMNYLAFHGEPWRLVTSAFPHANIFHRAFNLYWIWALGSLVEERFGHVRTGALYALLAAGSAVPQYAFEVGGIGLTVSKMMPVANYAHGAGAIIGALIGWIVERRSNDEPARTRIPAAVGLIVFLGTSLWAATIGRPLVNFSRYGGADVAQLGYDALMRNENEKAVHLFRIATSMRYPQSGEWLDLWHPSGNSN